MYYSDMTWVLLAKCKLPVICRKTFMDKKQGPALEFGETTTPPGPVRTGAWRGDWSSSWNRVGRRGEPNPRGATSARPQPRKNYWAPAHERRALPHHHLPPPPSKAPASQSPQPRRSPQPPLPPTRNSESYDTRASPMASPGAALSAALAAEDFPLVRAS